MEKTYNILIKGTGTKDQITQALHDVITGLIDVEDTEQFEDNVLYTEVESTGEMEVEIE